MLSTEFIEQTRRRSRHLAPFFYLSNHQTNPYTGLFLMSILVTTMIPIFFTRPTTTWVTTVVILLHGMTVWAMVSIDRPQPINASAIPTAIQVELITSGNEHSELLSTEDLSEPLLLEPLSSKKLPARPAEEVEPAKSPAAIEVLEPLVTKVTKNSLAPVVTIPSSEEVLASDATPKKEVVASNATPSPTSSVQSLTIVESRKAVRSVGDKEAEDDLSAMIRAVTAQFNREQAVQKRSADNQANRKRAEKQQWQAQAEQQAVEKMLALAATQAEAQTTNQEDLVSRTDINDEDKPFLADFGSWRDGYEPETSVPLLIWRSVDTDLGDIFIVTLELHVTKDGYITEVQVLESSGSPIIDAIATTQVRAGQLNPLEQDGIAVDAIIPMSLVYERA